MKTRNVILGFAALLFAVGTAFASLLAPQTQDSVFYVASPTCRPISEVNCGAAGQNTCKVYVNSAIPANIRDVFDANNCTGALKTTTSSTPVAIVTL